MIARFPLKEVLKPGHLSGFFVLLDLILWKTTGAM